MSYESLNVVKNLFCQAGNLCVQSQLHNSKVFISAKSLIISISFDLFNGFTTKISELLTFLRNTFSYLIQTTHQ